MEEFKVGAGLIAGALGLVFAVPYIIDTLRKRTQPHLYSWTIWSILQVIAVAAMVRDGAGVGALGVALGAVSCIVIALLALRYGTRNITRFDRACLAGALAATALYLGLEDALLAVMLVSIIDFVGFVPTMRKAYEEPGSETLSTWLIFAASNFFGILALQNYSWVTVLYMASVMVTSLGCAMIIIVRRRVPVMKEMV